MYVRPSSISITTVWGAHALDPEANGFLNVMFYEMLR
jgi:hypothetical protein